MPVNCKIKLFRGVLQALSPPFCDAGRAEGCRNLGFGCAFSALRLVDDYGDDYGGRFWSGHS